MAGEGGLDGDFSRLPVPDLTHHDNVRILSEGMPDKGGKFEPDGGIDLTKLP